MNFQLQMFVSMLFTNVSMLFTNVTMLFVGSQQSSPISEKLRVGAILVQASCHGYRWTDFLCHCDSRCPGRFVLFTIIIIKYLQ